MNIRKTKLTFAKALIGLFGVLVCSACAPTALPTTAPEATQANSPTPLASATATVTNTPAPFELTSPAFEEGGVIPDVYSCKGDDISPELVWGDPPAGTQSFALVFEDPGPDWVHWVVYNIPGEARGLPENVQPGPEIASGGMHGISSWGTMDYGGSCPPQGTTHDYVFTLYALDKILDLEPGVNKRVMLIAAEGHILAEIALHASFTR